MSKINVTIWNEFRHEKQNEGIKAIYPEGLHAAIARGIAADDLNIRLASLDEPEHGLTDEVIQSTDVLSGGATAPTPRCATTSWRKS